MHILTEQLVAQDGKTLFQRELEPIAAGHSIARPIVKILMGDHAFNRVKISISRCLYIGQHIFGVEDVEAFVFHRAHVEI